MKTLKHIILVLLLVMLSTQLLSCAATPAKETTSVAETPDVSQTAEETPVEESSPAESEEGEAIKKIKEAGVLVVGTSADYPPFEFHTQIDGEDTIVGFDIAVSQYFADSLGVELKIVDMSFDGLLISLSKGDFDLVMAALSPNDKRKEVADFTDILFKTEQIIIIRKEDQEKYTDLASLAGVKGGYQKGTVQETIAKEVLGEEVGIGLTKFYDLITELKTGKIDCVFGEGPVGMAYVSANDDLMVQDVGIVSDGIGFGGAVQKGNTELIDHLNQCIKELKEQGLLDQYLKEAVELAGVESFE